MNSKERDFIEWLKLSSANVTVVPPPAGFSSSALARWIIKAGYPCGNVGWESFAVGAAIPTTKFADKNVVVFMAEGPDDPTPEAFEFYGLSVTYVVTDDSPDKILRKVAAARIVAEHLNESAFRTFNGTQPENLSVTGETLLAEFMNAGIAVSGWVATGLSAYQISPIVQRVYPGKTTVLFDGEDARYGQAWMTELISSGKPVVIIGQHFTAFRYWAVATDDSPDKVVRKLHMALSTEENLSEPNIKSMITEESSLIRGTLGPQALSSYAWKAQTALLNYDITVAGWIQTGHSVADVAKSMLQSRAYTMGEVIFSDLTVPGFERRVVSQLYGKKPVVVIVSNALYARQAIFLPTDEPVDKVERKIYAASAKVESMITESDHRLYIERFIDEWSRMSRLQRNLKMIDVTVSGFIFGAFGSRYADLATAAGYDRLWIFTARGADELPPGWVKSCVVMAGKEDSSVGLCVFTNDSPEKVLRKITAASLKTESLSRKLIEGPQA